MKTDTIAAIATAMTNSGIGIIRISGEEAVEVADKMIRLKSSEKKLADCKSHTIHYGFAVDGDEVIDEVMVLLMLAPKSYTREDTVEIDCHGGTLVMTRILELVIKSGARPAEPGEFTKRAFLNGRIDLAQAESVIDVINAKNDFALKASIDQLQGAISEKIGTIRSEILHEIAFIESAIDDPEHYQLESYGDHLMQIVDEISDKIADLLKNAKNGLILKEGIRTVIVGKPNSGKSSLLNTLVGKDRAIVTDIAGTTRDVIEEQIRLNGISLNVIDTAGIRNTEDIVEKIGVDKAREYVETADLVIYVVDASIPLDEDDKKIIEILKERNTIILLNKSDLTSVITEEEMKGYLNKRILSISAKHRIGIDELENTIEEMFFDGKIQMNEEVYITNARHTASLMEVQSSLKLVKQSILDGMPEDFYSIDLMNAYEELGKIIGESVEDDLVNEIFSKFCMGK
ncbi:tRNA uridine-5-carboxymethylaminomethyl(34) synthesis GTPase MnmE [Roseburia sp. BX1005]|uniref:tRNA modification GTPase MnmE n=1 Tax=Roseburia zhanii TaxID=2763064 RepID=A0A923LQS1_9FIRM|nr:tRNA uridine-5-carboxymethylaminomethyl(34) synthesis GTPase MnmE [Roseburia zhanii]MBC5715218.1 tRNA uridine-5-carboxymethylaminomethyl(34) synthesis GTPase MnmE [Roseburia zhanii]